MTPDSPSSAGAAPDESSTGDVKPATPQWRFPSERGEITDRTVTVSWVFGPSIAFLWGTWLFAAWIIWGIEQWTMPLNAAANCMTLPMAFVHPIGFAWFVLLCTRRGHHWHNPLLWILATYWLSVVGLLVEALTGLVEKDEAIFVRPTAMIATMSTIAYGVLFAVRWRTRRRRKATH